VTATIGKAKGGISKAKAGGRTTAKTRKETKVTKASEAMATKPEPKPKP